jgi:hypothetical protein
MRPVAVCIPARNEARRLPALLGALAAQDVSFPVNVALCINNSTDDSARVAQAAAARSGGRLRLNMSCQEFPPHLAHAGSARRAAMDLGADWLGDSDALLVSTDADCRPPQHWLSANLASAGAIRIVGGRIELDEAEAEQWPQLFALRRRFDDYWHKVREIEDEVDPLPWDLPPRHGDHTGASLALTVGLYRAAGGVALIASGEDRALVAAAVAAGGQLVHPAAVWTRTSARPTGRASGGMADEMNRWLASGQNGDRPHVPAYRQWHCRGLWRQALRPVLGQGLLMRAEDNLPPMPQEMPLPERPRR